MKKLSVLFAMILLSSAVLPAFSGCQKNDEGKDTEKLYVSAPFEDKGFSETEVAAASPESFDSQFLEFPSREQAKLRKSGFTAKAAISNFNTVYSTLSEMWNYGKINTVKYTINTEKSGVADTRGAGTNTDLITVYSAYSDTASQSQIDCLTHELTHVAQEGYNTGYGGEDTDDNGSWIVEGMTDYSRYVFGEYPDGFALPAYSKSQSYTDSYRVTARFFVWIEENICPTFAEQMNDALRTERYASTLFDRITGYGLKELWAMYDADGGKITDPKTGRKTNAQVKRYGAYEWKIELE